MISKLPRNYIYLNNDLHYENYSVHFDNGDSRFRGS